MAEMGITVSALDLRTIAIGIGQAFDCVGEIFVEAGPATAGIEFALCREQRVVAAAADIGAIFKKVIVLSAKRCFSTFMHDHAFFCWCQLIHCFVSLVYFLNGRSFKFKRKALVAFPTIYEGTRDEVEI